MCLVILVIGAGDSLRGYQINYWLPGFGRAFYHESCYLHPHGPAPAGLRPQACSRIYMIHAGPVIVAVNPRARDLVELLQLLAADLAYLSIRDLDLGIIA